MLVLIALGAFGATMLGGLFALRFKDHLHLILGFSAGAVIGVAFFDLIPESIELSSGAHDPGFVTTIIALGFVLYLILDRLIVLHHPHGESEAHMHRGRWSAGTLSVHSFLDGVGIGFAFQVSPAIGAVVALAVLCHDFSDGINTVNMIVRAGGSATSAFRWLLIDAFAPVLGIIVASAYAVPETYLGPLLALFAGFFLYIGASDLLPESHHVHPKRWTTISTVLGIAFLYVAIQLAGV